MTEIVFPLLERIKASGPADPIPTTEELRRSLTDLQSDVGARAFNSFDYAKQLAASVWGAEKTSHFSMVSRELRVTDKRTKADRWQRARRAASGLRSPWDTIFLERIAGSQRAERRDHGVVLSAAYLEATALAWSRWVRHCEMEQVSETPTGTTLEAYARSLMHGQEDAEIMRNRDDGESTQDRKEPVSMRSCSSYLERIVAAYRLRYPGFSSAACEFVLTRYREEAKQAGSPTKTGNQIVGASAIYDLGFEQMDNARNRRVRGVHAARDFRNGLLLALGIALPQRARALSVLEFERTLFLPEPDVILIRIPGSALKLPEAQKQDETFERTFRNPGLYAALAEYRRDYRPLFDTGSWLFPSMLDRTAPISEEQIGKLSGDMTQRVFGVRVTIHRWRDNVATEASEELPIGPRAVPSLLGHRETTTGQRHYDHSQGIKASLEHEDFLDHRRSDPCELLI